MIIGLLKFAIWAVVVYLIIQTTLHIVWYGTLKPSRIGHVYCKNCKYRLPLESYSTDESDLYECRPGSSRSFSNDAGRSGEKTFCAVRNKWGKCPNYMEADK